MIDRPQPDLTSVAQFAIDLDHRIIFWNKACEVLTGYHAERMLGTDQQWKPFYPGKRPVLADLIVEHNLQTMLQLYGDHNVRQSSLIPGGWEADDVFVMNGRTFRLYFLAAPILDRQGSLVGAMETLLESPPETSHVLRSRHQAEAESSVPISKSPMPEKESSGYDFSRIIGKSMAMRRVFDQIAKAAATDANVIIYGESGTGKELAAHAIHQLSGRRNRGFVAVNCSAIPEELIESEFFGYKKGAFTGAEHDKPGFLGQADQGTLFLDEVGEISRNMQVKLLRAIEGYGFQPVGGVELQTADFRIIAATRNNLLDDVRAGLIRDDFFYRIHIVPIHIPPLRNRKEDILPLAHHFLKIHDDEHHGKTLSDQNVRSLLAYDWPGNVRELQNVMLRYLALGSMDLLGEEEAMSSDSGHSGESKDGELGDLHLELAACEKNIILRELKNHNWRRNQAAAALNISRKTLFRKMKSHGLI